MGRTGQSRPAALDARDRGGETIDLIDRDRFHAIVWRRFKATCMTS
jgi:hypothetical protein